MLRPQKWIKNEFIIDVAKLSIGTIAGRGIAFISLPILTRIYSPDDFGLLAALLALISSISVIAALRFDVAIPLAKTDEKGAALLVLSYITLSIFTLALILALILINAWGINFSLIENIKDYIWLLPLGVIITSGYSIAQNWSTRKRYFNTISRTKVTQSIFGVGTMVTLGVIYHSPIGLLIGNIFQLGLGSLRLLLEAIKRDKTTFKKITPLKIKQCLHENKKYPLYSAPDALANTIGSQIPIILIASFSHAEAGALHLAMQILLIPMSLIGGSVAQVYMSRSGEKTNPEILSNLTADVLQKMMLIGIGPLIFLGIIAPSLFPKLFGQEWTRAGQVATLFTPWMALHFICAPISTYLYSSDNLKIALKIQTLGMMLRLGTVAITLWAESKYLIESFAIASFIHYFIYIFTIINISNISKKQILEIGKKTIPSITIWTIIGLIFSHILLRLE